MVVLVQGGMEAPQADSDLRSCSLLFKIPSGADLDLVGTVCVSCTLWFEESSVKVPCFGDRGRIQAQVRSRRATLPGPGSIDSRVPSTR